MRLIVSNKERFELVEAIVQNLREKYPQAEVTHVTIDGSLVGLIFEFGKYYSEIPIYSMSMAEHPVIERLINPFHKLSFQQLNEYCEKEGFDCIRVYFRNILDLTPQAIFVDQVPMFTTLIPIAIRCATLEEFGEVVIQSAIEKM